MDRVLVTGLGTVNPLGLTVATSFAAMLEGTDGIRKIDAFDVSSYDCANGGCVPAVAAASLSVRENQVAGRDSQFLLCAAEDAFAEAGLASISQEERGRIGLYTGTTLGGLALGETFYRQLMNNPSAVRTRPLLAMSLHAANDLTMSKLALGGDSVVFSTACSASAHAIGCAFDTIRAGHAKIALAGGFETFSEVTYTGFSILRSMTSDKIRPFDRKRSGLVLGEGATVLVLEEYEHALARGAQPYAEIIGYGSTSDAYHMTAPHPQGDGAARAISLALADGGIAPADVDYVTAHGTATPANDVAETRALKRSLGDLASSIPVSSIKSMIGHTLGAAGAMGALAAILAIRRSAIPPTINYEEPDPECDLDYVPNEGRDLRIRVALANSFGFGGNNCVLAFRGVGA